MYKIKSKKTEYNGRMYRSRLEARWAAMFDLLDWRYDYEPYDLHGWVPDFILYGKENDVLVEVKPEVMQTPELTEKISKAISKGESIDEFRENLIKAIILSNKFDKDDGYGGVFAGLAISLSYSFNCHWKPYQDGCESGYDIGSLQALYDGVLFGDIRNRKQFVGIDYTYTKLLKLWNEAANTVMFKTY